MSKINVIVFDYWDQPTNEVRLGAHTMSYTTIEDYIMDFGYYMCTWKVADPKSVEKSTIHWGYYNPSLLYHYTDKNGGIPKFVIYDGETGKMITVDDIVAVKRKMKINHHRRQAKYDQRNFRNGPVPNVGYNRKGKVRPRSRRKIMNEVRSVESHSDVVDEYNIRVRPSRTLKAFYNAGWFDDPRLYAKKDRRSWKRYRKNQWK